MAVLHPATQPTAAITTSGAIVEVKVASGLNAVQAYAPVDRFLVVQTAGDATAFDVEFSADPAVADRSLRIAKFTGATQSAPVDNTGDFSRDPSLSIYCKITPNAGSNNHYAVKIYIDQDE